MKPMQVHRDLASLPVFKNAVITIGTFDGVHRGHQQILRQLRTEAAAAEGESIVITFDPHPREVLFPDEPGLHLLNTLEEKTALLAAQGIGHLVIVPFTLPFSRLSAKAYIEDFLVGNFHPHAIIIGYDHRFGHNREGDIRLLEKEQEKYHFRVIEIPRQVVHHTGVSSTRIRRFLEEGQVKLADELLGYAYFLSGTVIHGDKRGRKLGYPTANIGLPGLKKLIPGEGVYAVKAELHPLSGIQHPVSGIGDPAHPDANSPIFQGMLNIGRRPTFHEKELRMEVHLFDFDAGVYGRTLTVHFIDFIRGDKKFETVEGLVEEMTRDEIAAREILAR